MVLQATITVITIFSLAVNYQSNVYLKCQFVFIACYYFSLQLFVKGVQYYRKEKENNLKNKRRSRSFSKNNNREDTKKWNVARTRIIVIEISLIVIGVIIATVILKYQSQKEILYKDKGSMESFRIGLLGIQATIITLTISVVALISNNISEMYLGIAVSDYYLNKRPFIFKQNRIIYIGLMLLVGSILSYSNDKYIWQYYFFTITVSLILLSVTEIYALFRGSASSKNEIQLFIECSIRKSGNVKKKQILFKNFIDDWTDKSADQNYKQYEKYKKTLFLFFSELVLYNEMEVLNDIKSGCASEILSLLNSREELIQGRGIILFEEIYEKMWLFVIDEKFDANADQKFELLSEIYDELIYTSERISIDILERNIHWNNILDTINRVSFCLLDTCPENEYYLDLEYVYRMSMSAANIIRYKKERKHEEIATVVRHWGFYLSDRFIDSSYNIPDNKKEKYLWNKCKTKYYFARGFIDNMLDECIVENVFLRGMGNTYGNISKTEILYYISLIGYLYYLSEKEETSCITIDLKENARKILDNTNVNGIIEYYFSRNLDNILNYTGLQKDLYQMLKESEWSTKYDNGKMMIMEGTIREIYVFVMAVYSSIYNRKLAFNLSEPSFVYIDQFLENKENATKTSMRRFYQIFCNPRSNETEEITASKIDKIYESLDAYLRDSLKNEATIEAKKEQEKYEKEVKVDNVISTIKTNVTEHVIDSFKDLEFTESNDSISWKCKFKILSYNLFTDMITEKMTDRMYSDIDIILIANLIVELTNRNLLKKTYRSEFETDQEYIEFLKKNELYVLVGSEYVLKNEEYEFREEFKEYEKKCQCVYTGYGVNQALAIRRNELQIKVCNTDVKIESLPVSESGAIYNEQSGIYQYEVTNNIAIPFTEEELKEYLANKRKLITMDLEVEIVVNENSIGNIIIRDDKK